jgi:hypothetical protein
VRQHDRGVGQAPGVFLVSRLQVTRLTAEISAPLAGDGAAHLEVRVLPVELLGDHDSPRIEDEGARRLVSLR